MSETKLKLPKLCKNFWWMPALLLLVWPALSSAIEYQGFGGRPAFPDPAVPNSQSWFIYELLPGIRKQDAVEVVNNTLEEATFLVYPQDSIRSSDGGFALGQFGDAKSGVGAWVRLYEDVPANLATTSQDIIAICETESARPSVNQRQSVVEWCEGEDFLEITLPALSSQLVPFVITLPDKLDVGEHTGGIVIQRKEQTREGEEGGILITTRVGVRMYVTVPGEIRKDLTLSKFELVRDREQKKLRLVVGIINAGNASAELDLTLKVDDPIFGRNRQMIERQTQVLREDELVSNFDLTEPKVGILKFTALIIYIDGQGNEQQLTSEPISLWVIPWTETALLLVALILIATAAITLWRLRRKKYSTAGWADYAVKEGETITAIANRLNLSWKILARANGIKPPYVLETGQIIKLPALPKLGQKTASSKSSQSRKTPNRAKKII